MSSVATRLGVDAGRDLATSSLGQVVKDHIAQETGAIVRSNIHGLDVFEDDPRITIFSVNATGVNGTVHANPDRFLSFMSELHDQAASVSDQAKDVIRLLNYALMRPEPVAQIVFAFSAVEMLGQRETWTQAQKSLLADIAVFAEASSVGSSTERLEVSDAIEKSLHRLSLRQGVLRLLDRLNLNPLKSEWDQLYAERSTLVHGLAPRPGAEYSDLANRAVNLCGRILLKSIATELSAADRYADTFYELPPSQRQASAATTGAPCASALTGTDPLLLTRTDPWSAQ